MAWAMSRSGILNALRRSQKPASPASKRTFSSSSGHDDAYETAKWEKITYAGIVGCSILAVINLSKGHVHPEDLPAYPYMHMRNKEFPWGPNGLFEVKHH